jgi:hypothetical protein
MDTGWLPPMVHIQLRLGRVAATVGIRPGTGLSSTRSVGITGGAGSGYVLATSKGATYSYVTGNYGGQGNTVTTSSVVSMAS